MKQLSEFDLEKMQDADFAPDEAVVKKQVRAELKLSRLIPEIPSPPPCCIILDFHGKTAEEAWREIVAAIGECAAGGAGAARKIQVITGASGILKKKFQEWAETSIIAPYISSCKPLNNGSFEIRLKKRNDRTTAGNLT
ncbi:MAG: hypothetical protein LBD50_00735 [Rickettsiales bacterium]|jgi:DNA-nicking Smr family endonuclease|nr:hypothetical protein [Rickettsiales bacterium]